MCFIKDRLTYLTGSVQYLFLGVGQTCAASLVFSFFSYLRGASSLFVRTLHQRKRA